MILIVNNINPTIRGNPLVPILFVFPDSIKAVKKKALPLFLQLVRSVPFCGSVLSTSLWVSMHKNAQFKQRN
jgi:hypothetical protein